MSWLCESVFELEYFLLLTDLIRLPICFFFIPPWDRSISQWAKIMFTSFLTDVRLKDLISCCPLTFSCWSMRTWGCCRCHCSGWGFLFSFLSCPLLLRKWEKRLKLQVYSHFSVWWIVLSVFRWQLECIRVFCSSILFGSCVMECNQ